MVNKIQLGYFDSVFQEHIVLLEENKFYGFANTSK